jgi:serine/threonine-protein kinase
MNLTRLDPEPAASVEPGEAAARRIRLAALVRTLGDYDGGGCFFAAPVVLADGSPAIEGYGLSTAPFRALDQTIRRADGFEADIGVRQVAEPQCPAIAFLDQLRKTPAAPIKLELAAASLRAGQPLSGSVSGADGREIAVLIVAADGAARAVPATRSGADGAMTFSVRPDPGEGGQQLILAVAGEKSLAGLRSGQTTASAKLFPAALSEAEKNGGALAATAHAFKEDK